MIGSDTFLPIESTKGELLDTLRKNREVVEWNTSNLKGINPLVCHSSIYCEEDDSRGVYLIDIMVEEVEDHIRGKE